MHINKNSKLIHDRAERVKFLRKEILRLSRPELARRYHLSTGTIQNWEDARHGGLTENGANKIIEILSSINIQCDLQWLMYGLGKKPIGYFDIKGSVIKHNEKTSSNALANQISDELALFYVHN